MAANKRKRRVVMIFPGLSGGSDKGYVKAIVKTLISDGFEVAVFHNRGVCNTPYTSLEFSDLTRNEEVESAIEFVKKRAGADADIVGIGMSLGANLLMRAAGMQGNSFPLKAIAAVNNPFDLWLAISLMRGTRYENYLAKDLKRNLICRDKDKMTQEEHE